MEFTRGPLPPDGGQSGRPTGLDAVFAPRSVALIGASERPGSVGRTILRNLIDRPFGGSVYPVNHKREHVLGIKAYHSISEVAAPVDLAVIAMPAAGVPEVVRQCVEHDVQAAVIISAGFRESGPAGVELERRVLAEARRGALRIVGPNCVGVMDPMRNFNATFAEIALPGRVAFVSQSGALGTAILDWCLGEHVGFSKFVSIGTMADVGWGDLIEYLGDDPNTDSILLAMESVGDAASFLSAARAVAPDKPIIVITSGRTGAAAKAAASHTGALTGSDDVLDAAFRRCGVLRVDRIDDLFAMADILAKQPPSAGRRLAIVTNAGGPGVLATDALPAAWTPDEGHRRAIAETFEAASAAKRTLLTELESKRVLAAYGIPVVETRLASSADEAAAHAEAIGYPVVLKLNSTAVTHEAAVGGVHRHLSSLAQVRAAYAAIERETGAAFEGVTVQPMVERPGFEVMIGSSVDAQFGPVLAFALGGGLVEIAGDRALGLPPLTTTLARRMMEQTRIYRALIKPGCGGGIDLDALESLLVRFGQLVVELPRIKEIDVNPLLVSPAGTVALDARVILHDAGVADEALPRPAIRAYPSQYVAEWTLEGGEPVRIRPIRPEDEPAMRAFHRTISTQSVHLRYGGLVSLDERTAHERLSRLCFIDYAREMALVVERMDRRAQSPSIVAVARLVRRRARPEAEFAILVGDGYQHRGIGSELLRRLVEIARRERWGTVVGSILRENAAMQEVCRNLGFTVRFDPVEEAMEARLAGVPYDERPVGATQTGT